MMHRALLILLLLGSGTTLRAQSVYRDLTQTFAAFDQRLPGGVNFEAGLAAVEAQLQRAGLETHRQTYNTLVPRTQVCELTVDGQALAPVYPLGPNGVAVTTTTAAATSA